MLSRMRLVLNAPRSTFVAQWGNIAIVLLAITACKIPTP